MVKPSHFFGRCALSAILAVSMVPSTALAQDGSGIDEAPTIAQSSSADSASVQSESGLEAASASSKSFENSAQDTDKFTAKVSWDAPVAGTPTVFHIESLDTSDNYSYFKYRLGGVSLQTSNGWELVDYSQDSGFAEEQDYSVTFHTSGTYQLRFECFGSLKNPLPGEAAHTTTVRVEITIDDPNYPTVDQRIEAIVAECQAKNFSTEYEKALWLHDWIVGNCEYDNSLTNAGTAGLLATGSGTCAAYRTLYEMLLKKLGIQSERMTGNGHEWNAIKLDGAWYQVDVTWDDDTGVEMSKLLSDEEKRILQHQYFGMSDQFTALVHSEHEAQVGYECPSLAGHYLVKNGYVKKWADAYAAEIAQKISAGQTNFEVAATKDALGTMLSMYGKVPHQLMAWDLAQRNWGTCGGSKIASVKVDYQHGASNNLGKFTVAVVKESASTGGSTGSGGSTVTPTPQPEKAKPGLTAYGSSYRYGKPNGTYAKNEWVALGGKWYYFGADGVAAKWETKIGGYWYYFNGKCQMVTGWVTWNNDKTKSYFDGNGRALTGLQRIGGATYYFDPATARSRKWEVRIGNDLYYFNGNYQMVTGWVTWNADKTKSYFASNGKALKGLQKIGSATYYFDPSTCRSRRWEVRIGNDLYYFNGSYRMVTGWVTWRADGTKSYFAGSGKALKGLQRIGGATYYFDPATGKSKRWEQWIGGKLYYFNGKYQMVTGWVTWNNDKAKSYFDVSGRALTGWQRLGGRTYYFNPATARSVRWEQTIGGARYYFDGNGRMHTGWLQWRADGKWSYFYSNGKMATGTQTIDGKRYTFDADGRTMR